MNNRISRQLPNSSSAVPLDGHPRSDDGASPGAQQGQLALSAVLSAITIAQIASAFGIQWYTIAHLGVGSEADALYAGATLPQAATALLIEPLGFVLLPFLSSKAEGDREKFAWPLVCVVGVISLVVAIIIALLAPLAVRVLAPGLADSAAVLTTQLSQIQVLGLIGTACGTVLSCLWQSKGHFAWPAVSVLLCTGGGWLLLVLGLDQWGVQLAAWTQVIIAVSSAVLLLPTLGRIRGNVLPEISILFQEVWCRMRPLVMSASYNRTGFVIDRFLASLLSPGSIALLDLVLRVHSAIGRVLNQGVVAPIVPRLAQLASKKSWERFDALWGQRALWMGCLSAGVVLVLTIGAVAAYRMNALDYVGAYGKLDREELVRMWGILMGCSGVVLAGGVNHIFVNAFYAQGDMVSPAKIETLTYTIGLVMKGIGVWFGGLVGIAIAISAYYLLNSVVLGVALRRQLRQRASTRASWSVPEPLR